MSSSKDIRTLCASCRAEYWNAGYRTISVYTQYKEQCDRCRVKMGWTYIVEKRANKSVVSLRKKPR